eukprot:824715-Pleurochrysis_carterae.AAC.1
MEFAIAEQPHVCCSETACKVIPRCVISHLELPFALPHALDKRSAVHLAVVVVVSAALHARLLQIAFETATQHADCTCTRCTRTCGGMSTRCVGHDLAFSAAASNSPAAAVAAAATANTAIVASNRGAVGRAHRRIRPHDAEHALAVPLIVRPFAFEHCAARVPRHAGAMPPPASPRAGVVPASHALGQTDTA